METSLLTHSMIVLHLRFFIPAFIRVVTVGSALSHGVSSGDPVAAGTEVGVATGVIPTANGGKGSKRYVSPSSSSAAKKKKTTT